MRATIVIKRNVDRNYDRLFAQVEKTVLFSRDAVSESERATPAGYVVQFASLDADVIAWLEARPADFAIQYD